MCHLNIFWQAKGIDDKSMILTGDFDFACLQILNRMISTAMSKRHFVRLRTKRQSHQLMPNANTENGRIGAN